MRLSFPMILVFSAGSRGQWKQTKSAVARWTPSPSSSMLQWERRGLEKRMTDKHAGIVCRSHQLNRAKGSREELPCRVQGQRPCWGQGATPLGALSPVNPNKRRENQKNMWKCGANYDIIGMLAPEKRGKTRNQGRKLIQWLLLRTQARLIGTLATPPRAARSRQSAWRV